ncbi:MAG: PEF-CTERM sorting domain-containing protein, partial [ANME-2 cluster archaeon]|nr:PEF-CTERM sorting domain-containing protein [ANME-2 cluster archaeon]
IVVGAYGDDDGGSCSGSAYVFTRSGTTWTEQQKLTASDPAVNDLFGNSVSVDGDTIVVGVLFDDDGGSLSGSAYVFTRSGTTWTEQQKLTASDATAGDHFGCSVSVDGDTIVVGSDSGSAYVFASLVILASCDDSGAEQNTFDLSEDVYCLGENLAASTSVDIYVVNNKDVWKDGDALIDVSGGYETEMTGDDGSISTTLIWDSPLTLGSYDIVVDTNQNREWNKGEPIDDIVSVGFEAIPEFPSIALPVTAILGLMFLFSHRRRNE